MHATNLRLLPPLLLFSLGIATGLLAQTSSDSAQRVEQKRTDLSGAPEWRSSLLLLNISLAIP